LGANLIVALKDYENYLNSLKDKYIIFEKIDKPMRFLFSDINAGEIGTDKIVTNPEECLIRLYMMNYPDIDENSFNDMMFSFLKNYKEIYKYIEDGSITFTKQFRFIEGGNLDLSVDKNKDFLNNIIKNGEKLTNRKLNISAMLGGTDFFAFNNYGNTPAVVFGPGGGNCHAPDEYVYLKDLLDLSKIYAWLIYYYCC
jgi:acetylornithine deacetylase